jgi:hypothetical protein
MSTALRAAALPGCDLSPEESASVVQLLEGTAGQALARGWPGPAARRLPERLLDFLDEFSATESAGGAVIRGFPVDDVLIGPTPGHWREAAERTSTTVHERYLSAVASVLGQVFAFRALQGGRLVQDLLPITGHEYEKSGSSSRSLLDLHTEDAFHPNRCDYLGLLCLRNVDEIPTTYAELEPSTLPADVLDVLFQPRFTIEPDPTHLLLDNPQPTALLWGAKARPYLRVDDSFTHPLPGDADAERALAALIGSLAQAERAVTLHAGDVLFIDNHLAVHGRRPFKARYDGTDRWLKRVNVTRDLRRSRALREPATSRVLG